MAVDNNGEQIIIGVAVDVGDTTQKLADVTKRIEALKVENKALQSTVKAGGAGWEDATRKMAENDAQIRTLTATQRTYQGVLTAATSDVRVYGSSIKEQRALLSDLKNQYTSLSAAERESAEGQAFLAHLQAIEKEVKAAEASMGEFQRNVGNYPTTVDIAQASLDSLTNSINIQGVSVGKIIPLIQGLGSMFSNGLVNGLKMAGNQVVAFGKTLLASPLAPFIAIAAALVAIIDKLSAAIKKNDDLGTAWNKAMAAFQPVIELITAAFDKLAAVIAGVATAIASVIGGVMKFLGVQKEVNNEAQKTIQMIDDLEEADRQYTVNSAKNDAERARLLTEAKKNDEYSLDERRKMIEEANRLDLENAEMQRVNQEKRIEIMKREAEVRKDTSDATKDAIANATAELIRIEENYQNAIREGTATLVALAESEAAAVAAAAEKKKKAWQDYLKQLDTQRAAYRALTDAEISLIEEGKGKEILLAKEASKRVIEDLQLRLKNEEGLTKQAREYISQLIIVEEAKLNKKLDEINENYSKESIQKQYEIEIQRLDLLLQKETENSEKYFDLRINLIEKNKAKELDNERLTAEERANIRLKYELQYDDLLNEINQNREQKRKEIIANQYAEMELELQQRKASEEEMAAFELQKAQEQMETIKRAEYDTEEQYNAAIIASKMKVIEAEKKVQESARKTLEMQLESMQAFGDAMVTTMESVAGDSKEFVIFEKMMALAQVSLNLAKAISAATASGAQMPGPLAAATIAINVAAVIASFASVVKAIEATNIPDEPKFAAGGVVQGNSYTGDNVPVKVNSGEMILTKDQQARLFALANGAQAPAQQFDYAAFAEAAASAVAELPAPILDYTEFQNFTKRVINLQENATI